MLQVANGHLKTRGLAQFSRVSQCHFFQQLGLPPSRNFSQSCLAILIVCKVKKFLKYLFVAFINDDLEPERLELEFKAL